MKALHQQLKDENKRNLIISLILRKKGYAQQIQQMTSRWVYPVQRALALCGVWGRVLVASLTLACAMRGDRDLNPGHPDGTALKQTAQKKG